ncbi:hypothetical protein [Undibacterium sp. TS12]|uniref:hypothetical protein n=1 Tax=Undibacterium sp. TS12 TaxID=2908202 RepID=UPI001F4D0D5F|nr:hypothetical protein [Undibacterium sp. TS12]MCH8623042.1 hypothetical protein [Undibacterium sp. TS12]
MQQTQRSSVHDGHPAAYLDVSLLSVPVKQVVEVPLPPAPRPVYTVTAKPRQKPLPSALQIPAANEQKADSLPDSSQISGITQPTSLDLDSLRRGAVADDKKNRVTASEGKLKSPVAQFEQENNLGKEIKKASREDCFAPKPEGVSIGVVKLTGLLAGLPVIVDTIRGKGCKW